MLSYIHAYHAGNHADIIKHAALSLVIEALKKKDKPFTIIDTHAGSGIYRIDDERLRKTNEFAAGAIADAGIPEIKSYADTARKYAESGEYPGSPALESELMRNCDELILSELHPRAIEELRAAAERFPHKPRIHFRDGYETAIALTPPKTKRGICVIDPSYEDAGDFEKCAETIVKIRKRWPAGIIALWYPLVAHRIMEISMMKERIRAASQKGEPDILDVQLEMRSPAEMTGLASLYGSGMFIVNFPYTIDEKISAAMPKIAETLSARSWSVDTL